MEQMLKMNVRVEQQTFAKHGLNHSAPAPVSRLDTMWSMKVGSKKLIKPTNILVWLAVLVFRGGSLMAEDLIANFSAQYVKFYNAVEKGDLKEISNYALFSEPEMMKMSAANVERWKGLPDERRNKILKNLEARGVHSFDDLRDPINVFAALIKPMVLSNYPQLNASRWVRMKEVKNSNEEEFASMIGTAGKSAYAITFFRDGSSWKIIGMTGHSVPEGDSNHVWSGEHTPGGEFSAQLLQDVIALAPPNVEPK